MTALFYLPSLLQGIVTAIDEILFHRRRGLGTWEVFGHPLDTITVAVAYAYLRFAAPSPAHAVIFAGIAVFSSLFVTKDEFVHAALCEPLEHWLHSLLFLLHPTAFAAAAYLWFQGEGQILIAAQLVLLALFFFFQLTYWGIPWARKHFRRSTTASTKPTAIAGTPPTTIPSRS